MSASHQGDRPATAEELTRFLAAHPDTKAIDAIFVDLSGIVRGKRIPVGQAGKLFESGMAMPGSVFLLDTQGESHDPLGRGFSDGDPDHAVRVIPGSLKPVPWSDRPLGQVMLRFYEHDGQPYGFDPRTVLEGVVRRLSDLGLRPVVAFELEFYLIDRARAPGGAPQPPLSPLTGERDVSTQVYGMNEIDGFADLLTEAHEACAAQGVPTGTLTAEYAPGQFEINLLHIDDPLLAADHCVCFKRAVKGVARNHGLQATFMPKPYLDQAGSGMHLHVSLLDESGRNLFDGGKAKSSPTLRHALGGVLETLPEAMGILVPNPNGYRRFQPNIFVPIKRSWGYENRSVALRIPSGDGASRRIEHRVAGADANPYLVLATILAGIHHGISGKLDPGAPAEGNAGDAFDPTLPLRPRRALEAMQRASILPDYFGADYVQIYAACKLAELDKFESVISPNEYLWYLQAD